MAAAASMRLLGEGTHSPAPKPAHMPLGLGVTPPLETALLRRSVGDLAAREARCHHCHRTPLVGEWVHVYGSQLVCDLCRSRRRATPSETRLVHSAEHERAVRILRAA
jgi:hypothetical protein